MRSRQRRSDAEHAGRYWRPRTWRATVQWAYLLGLALFCLAPLYVMVTSSFTPADSFGSGDALAPPASPTLDNYRVAWSDLGFGRMMVNSAMLTLLSTAIAVALSTAAAFGLSRYRVPGRPALLVAMVAAIAVPPIVVALPLFDLAAALNWIDTVEIGVAVEVGLLTPFCTYLLYSYMRDLPAEQFEAAVLDGAGAMRQFIHVAVPLSRPSIVTASILSVVFVWNDLLVPLIFWPSSSLQTLMTGLATLGPGRTGLRDVPLLMAGVAITVVPLVALFLVGRRAFRRGLLEGGVK